MTGLDYDSGEERALNLPSSPPFNVGRAVEGPLLHSVAERAANLLQGLIDDNGSDMAIDQEHGDVQTTPTRPRKQALKLRVNEGVTTRSRSGIPPRRPSSPPAPDKRPPRQPAAPRSTKGSRIKAKPQPKSVPPRPSTPDQPQSMSKKALPSRPAKPSTKASTQVQGANLGANPFVTPRLTTIISSDSLVPPEDPVQLQESPEKPPPKRRKRVDFTSSQDEEQESLPIELEVTVTHESVYEGEKLSKRSKTIPVAHKAWYEIELLAVGALRVHTQRLGLQYVITSRLASVTATGGGPGAFKETDIELMARRDWEDLVDVLKHQMQRGRKHITLGITTAAARFKGFIPPPAIEATPIAPASSKQRDTRPPVLSASKRDFESTQKTRSSLLSAMMEYYDCKRRCNGSSKYCLVDDEDPRVHHAVLEADFTALVDSIELSRLTSAPLTVEEPGAIWMERVIRANQLRAAKKKKDREKEQPAQPPPTAPPPYYAQAPWFAPPAWPPHYHQQSSAPQLQPQSQPQPPGGSPSRKSSPVNSDPDINHLEQYCDWLGRRYPRYQKGLEEAKDKLVDDFYTITTLHGASDARLTSLLGKGGLVILLKKYIKEFQREQRALADAD